MKRFTPAHTWFDPFKDWILAFIRRWKMFFPSMFPLNFLPTEDPEYHKGVTVGNEKEIEEDETEE